MATPRRVGLSRRLVLAIVCSLAALVGSVGVAPTASAAVASPLALQIETLTPTGFSAGDAVSLRFTATNATGAALTNLAGAMVWIELAHSYVEDLAGSMSGCAPGGWGDLGDYSVDLYVSELPAEMAAGSAVSCTFDYVATAADVANGGIFATLKYRSPAGQLQDTAWRYVTVPAVGVAAWPSVTGPPVVGQVLGVSSCYWGMWDAGFAYQWLRNGTAIAGATHSTYQVTTADLDAHLSVQVVGTSDVDGSTILKTSPSTPAVARFSDVGPTTPFAADILWMAQVGITTGYPDGTFRPAGSVARDAMAAFLYRFSGRPAWMPPTASPFADLAPSAAFYAEITWLADRGVTTGYLQPVGTRVYRPADPVARDAMAAFLYRLAGKPAWSAPATSPFTDVPTTHPFYREITWLASIGVTTGWAEADGTRTFRPSLSIARDAMAAFMHRFDTHLGAGSPARG